MNGTVPEGLRAFFCAHPKAALAFSGGCDSAYLMYAALQCGVELGVYYVKSQFQPAFELEDAVRLARQMGCEMRILALDVLQEERVRENPGNRCYYCKGAIFAAIQAAARLDGYDILIDGTNASDDASDRPGMVALREMNVLSPLRLCGITKAQVRRFSREAGLFTWNKPAYACLATRIPAGMEIREELLQRVEQAEKDLSEMGFADFRVRIVPDGAKLEIREEQLPMLVQKHRDVLAALQGSFREITLDLHLRRERET